MPSFTPSVWFLNTQAKRKKIAKKLKPVIGSSQNSEAEAKVMFELMRMIKSQEGRDLFASKLDPKNIPSDSVERVGACVLLRSVRTFEFLSAIIKAALREGISTRDFQLNKTLMDQSYVCPTNRLDCCCGF
jgi:hypothetical protein